jgi:hypothetical protein
VQALDAAGALAGMQRTAAAVRAVNAVLGACAHAAHRFPERGSLETMAVVLSDLMLVCYPW